MEYNIRNIFLVETLARKLTFVKLANQNFINYAL